VCLKLYSSRLRLPTSGKEKPILVKALVGEGGERGIRTPGPVTVNGFQDRRIRPLCHLSGAKIGAGGLIAKKRCSQKQHRSLMINGFPHPVTITKNNRIINHMNYCLPLSNRPATIKTIKSLIKSGVISQR
jgi:hypothetical protein